MRLRALNLRRTTVHPLAVDSSDTSSTTSAAVPNDAEATRRRAAALPGCRVPDAAWMPLGGSGNLRDLERVFPGASPAHADAERRSRHPLREG